MIYKNKNTKDRLQSYCKVCQKEYRQNYYLKNKSFENQQVRIYQNQHPEHQKINQLKTLYGITLDQYNKLLQEQNNVCAICGNKELMIDKRNNKPRMLAVDHNHKTHKVRGLLCGKCNKMIGLSNDDNNILISAINYLNNHNT